MIKRANMSESYSSNIPLAMIKDLEWEKGDKLNLAITKVLGRRVVVIFNDEDDNGRD